MTSDGRAGSPGFLGVQVITSDSTGNVSSEAGKREASDSAVFFSGARIPNTQKPQEAHFAALTMRVDRGHHCLVVGGTAARRQAVFKALLGTQPISTGVVGAPPSLIHVSSRPYVKPGSSLWDLLIFPHDKTQSIKRGVRERHLAAVLHALDAEYLLSRASDDWGRVVDWAKVLGAKELYVLALARLVYHSPPFALLDDTACLRADQVLALLGIARRHRITLIVASSDPDPFDPRLIHTESPLMAGIAEFSRALRLSNDDESWAFCAFGYAAQRPAFDDEPADYLWAAAESRDLRLRRRVSALSQCSTTERRWLMATDNADSSRRQSRVVSPTLTARSSMSDINAVVDPALSIGRALAKSSLLLSPPLSSSSSSSGADESVAPEVLPVAVSEESRAAGEPSVFSPAKNPYARPKNYQRSRPSLSLFSSAKQQDVSRRPFSRNGEEEEEEGQGVKEVAPITPVAKIRHVSSTSVGEPSPSRIPRPPSSVSRIDRASPQTDASSVTSLMATLSIGAPKLSPAADYSAQQLPLDDEFTAALNNM
ncbi:ATP-binding cassette sub- D member 3 [Coemansia sp. BCRC 34301]|nr:ATP-binding cassette sub- D member 3 [Coemansia sp. BCRC 34301]